jgi:SAM-dependent methyltransferase
MSNIFKCRACGSEYIERIYQLRGFPSSAQHFLPSADSALDDKSIDLLLSKCSECDLLQLENDPVAYYKDVITASSLSESSKVPLIKEWEQILSFIGRKDDLSALEVGAYRGEFLDVLSRVGVKQATGLENNPESVAIGRANGLDLLQGYLISAELSNLYDIIVCNNYLEHQPDVQKFLEKIRDQLKDDGYVYISVPNLSYLLERSCLYEFVADHLVYFNRITLRRLVEGCKFTVILEYLKNNENDIVIVARKSQGLNYEAIYKKAESIISSLKRYVSAQAGAGKKIAIWGAGHRALALMALAKTSEISFVVDSAKFKQGLYTPILGKRIVSPEELYNSHCDIVILMLPGETNRIVKNQLQGRVSCEIVEFSDSEF